MSYRDAWKQYAYGTAVDHFVEWCRDHCVQSIAQHAGQPLELEPWQIDFMAEALAVDENYNPYWRIVVKVLPRKNGKTTEMAAYAAYHADVEEGEPTVLLSASGDKQAGRLFDSIVSFVKQSDYLSERFHLRSHIGEIARTDGGAKMHRLAANPEAIHGHNPSLVIADELHAWTKPNAKKSWPALITAGGARESSQAFVITTAGEAHERATGILGTLIDGNESAGEVERRTPALTISRNHKARVLIYNYSAPVTGKTPKDRRQERAAIRSANPASWITDEYLEEMAADTALTDAQFLQLHGCVWTDSDDVYISPEIWKGLGDGGPIPPGRSICMGLDGSEHYDTTVVARASRAEDGRIDVDATIFSARHDTPHHIMHSKRIDYEKVEEHIIDQFEDRPVAATAYDPRYLGRSVDIIDKRLPEAAVIRIDPSGRYMREALEAFYRNVVTGTIRHTGDPAILAHIAACKAEMNEKGWKIGKRDFRKPIDAVVAMAMAVYMVEKFGDASYDVGFETLTYDDLIGEEHEQNEYADLFE